MFREEVYIKLVVVFRIDYSCVFVDIPAREEVFAMTVYNEILINYCLTSCKRYTDDGTTLKKKYVRHIRIRK